MGIDLSKSRVNRFDRNKWYKAENVNNMKLLEGAIAEGVFYSIDTVPFSMSFEVAGGNTMVKKITGTIETLDVVSGMEVHDYVLYDGELYIIENIIYDDVNENKELSSRPSFVTTIQLRR